MGICFVALLALALREFCLRFVKFLPRTPKLAIHSIPAFSIAGIRVGLALDYLRFSFSRKQRYFLRVDCIGDSHAKSIRRQRGQFFAWAKQNLAFQEPSNAFGSLEGQFS
jgi:hypothetical protein